MLQQSVGLARRELATVIVSPEHQIAIAEDLELDTVGIIVRPEIGLQGVVVLPDAPKTRDFGH
jgi:hypothetical protein